MDPMRYSYVEHRPRVSRTVSHGRASATQDGDWDSDDLERLVFEMPPSCRLQPDGPMAAYGSHVPKKLFCNWPFGIHLVITSGWSWKMSGANWDGACNSSIAGMARGGERIEKNMPCPAINVMNNKMWSIRSKSLELYTWSRLEQQQHQCSIQILYVYNSRTAEILQSNFASTRYQTGFSRTFVDFT